MSEILESVLVAVVIVVFAFGLGTVLREYLRPSGKTFRVTFSSNFLEVIKEVQEKQGVSMGKAISNSVMFLDILLNILDGKPDHKVAIIDKGGNSVFVIELPESKGK